MNRIIAVFLLILVSIPAFSDENWTIKIDGRVTSGCEELNGAVVSLIKNTRIIQEIVTLRNGKFVFVLKPDNEYVIAVSKKGYVSKSIYFSTHNVPNELLYTLLYPEYPVEITMFRTIEGLSTSVIKNPVGRIVYSQKMDDFEVDLEYAEQMKPELQKIYKELKLNNKVFAKTEVDDFTIIKEIVISAEKRLIHNKNNEIGLRLISGLSLLESKRQVLKKQLANIPGDLVSVETYFDGRKEILIRIIKKSVTEIEYKRVTQPWGSKFYFKDGISITKHVFQLESDVASLIKSKVVMF